MCISRQDWPTDMYMSRIGPGICVWAGLAQEYVSWVGLAQEYVSGQDWPRNMCVSE